MYKIKRCREMENDMYKLFNQIKKGFIEGYKVAMNGGGKIQLNSDLRKNLDVIDVNNIPIYFCKSNYAVAASGSSIGCLMNVKSQIIGDFDCIFVDETFEQSPEFVRQFILHHELGHYVHDDLNKLSKHNYLKRLLGLEKAITLEFNADRYAASVLSPNLCIDALIWIDKNTYSGFACRREVKKRIKELQKM